MKQHLSYSRASELGSVLHAALQRLDNVTPLSEAGPRLLTEAIHTAYPRSAVPLSQASGWD